MSTTFSRLQCDHTRGQNSLLRKYVRVFFNHTHKHCDLLYVSVIEQLDDKWCMSRVWIHKLLAHVPTQKRFWWHGILIIGIYIYIFAYYITWFVTKGFYWTDKVFVYGGYVLCFITINNLSKTSDNGICITFYWLWLYCFTHIGQFGVFGSKASILSYTPSYLNPVDMLAFKPHIVR